MSGSEQDYAYKFQTTLQGQITHHLSLNLHFEYEFDNAIFDTNASRLAVDIDLARIRILSRISWIVPSQDVSSNPLWSVLEPQPSERKAAAGLPGWKPGPERTTQRSGGSRPSNGQSGFEDTS